MKNTLLVLAGSMLLLATAAVQADDSTYTNSNTGMSYDKAQELFRANEFSVDAFGTAAEGKYTVDHLTGNRLRHHTHLGVGVGGDYFFTRMLGISGMVYSQDTSGPFVDNASMDLTFRFPIGHFAPYAFGGGGKQIDRPHAWYGEFGGGVDVRFTPHIGIFADVRGIVPDHKNWYAMERLGFKFTF